MRGKTSNGYYVSGGNGYQVVYGYGGHVQFTKPFIKYGVLSSNDKQIISKSNASVGSGCCGGGGSGVGSSNDIPDKIPDGTTTRTEDPVDVNKTYLWVKSRNGITIRSESKIVNNADGSAANKVCGAKFNEKLEVLGSKQEADGLWYNVKKLSGESVGKTGWARSDNLSNEAIIREDVINTPLTEDQKVFIATMSAEAGSGVSTKARKAMAHTVINRVLDGAWAGTPGKVCAQKSQYSGYNDNNYKLCMQYLKNRDGTNYFYEQVISEMLSIYKKEEADFTDNSCWYYTPRWVSEPDWVNDKYELKVEVFIDGIDSYNEGRFFRRKRAND